MQVLFFLWAVAAETVSLEMLCHVLDTSLDASRSDYGVANVENWD